jgi:sugar lactone lactonase YvrE
MKHLEAVQATPPWAWHGEGPIWDRAAGVLRWLDMLRGDVLSWRPGDTDVIRWDVGEVAAVVRRRRTGGFVVGVERGFQLLAQDGSLEWAGPELWTDPSVRMNEGACSPSGQLYCGSMGMPPGTPEKGSMYLLEPDLSVRPLIDRLTVTNGLVFTPDGQSAYHIDTPLRCLRRFRIDDDGAMADPVVAFDIPSEAGDPDGMTVDADGCFWIALWGGSAVHQYAPDGELLAVVHLPVSRPTACHFGGPDLHDLYITTSHYELDPDVESERQAGAVYVVRTEASGAAEEIFAG